MRIEGRDLVVRVDPRRQVAPIIIEAKEERDAMLERVRDHSRPGDLDRWNQYLSELRRDGGTIPGWLLSGDRTAIAAQYLAAKLDVARSTIWDHRPDDIPTQIGAPLNATISEHIGVTQGASAIDFYEVDEWVRRLTAACFLVIGYLSGMRTEECLALTRGCCRQSDPDDPLSRFEIRGLVFKVSGPDGNTVRGGQERDHPWYVIEPVAAAVAVMERLHPHDLLFPSAAFSRRRGAQQKTLAAHTHSVNVAIRQFIEWCNTTAHELRRPWEHIAEDPEGPFTIRRLRRTLAWFIYRLPFGRISLGIQYGHITLNTTDRYGSRGRHGIGTVFQFEEAAAIRDNLEAAADRLAAGERVSGPAADRYIAGVTEYSDQYQGRYLTRREMVSMSTNPNLRIYDNGQQFLACCYDGSRALCHPDRATGLGIEMSPDLANCRPECANVARTDEHIAALEQEVQRLEEERASPATPKPWRVRLRQRIRRLQRTIRDHLRLVSTNDAD